MREGGGGGGGGRGGREGGGRRGGGGGGREGRGGKGGGGGGGRGRGGGGGGGGGGVFGLGMSWCGLILKGDGSLVQASWIASKGVRHRSALRCLAKLYAATKARTWSLRLSRLS